MIFQKHVLLEVDLEYPKELFNLRNDYSLAPEKIGIKKDMMLDYLHEDYGHAQCFRW